MRWLCLSAALLVLLVILVDSIPVNIHHIQDEGLETSHTRELEKRSVVNVVKSILGGVITGSKIVGKGATILGGLAKILNRTLKGQVMISSIQFNNYTEEELPTLEIEYSPLTEETKGVETSHKQGIEKRSVLPVVTGILGGVLKGAKIFGTGASILTGLAEIVNKALKGQVMISGIQFDNHTAEELPTLQIEYSTLNEENKGVETSHKQGIEKRSVLPVVTGILGGVLKGAKIFGTGASILTGLAEIVNKALKGQVMISGIQFDNHTAEELPTLQIEYSTLNEENKGVETSHKQGIEKRSVLPVVTGILGGVLKGAKIFGTGASILTGLAEIVNKALKGQVMISGIQFDNHTAEELPTLQIEYSTLNEENKGVETSHKQGIEKRSVLPVVTGILGGVLKGAKIFGTGASILTGLAEIVNKALKGQVMISGIQFDNHTAEELPTLQIEYSTLNEENKGVETSHKQGIEKRSVLPVVTGILGGVLKGAKIFGTGASILTGLAEIVNKALKGQVMISGIQFDNHTAEELPTLQIEYSTLNEENKGVETSHKQGIEKRSVLPVVTGILGGVLKGAKIFGTGASILTGLAEIVNKALKGQVMISGIQFDNHTAEELPTLQIEYSTLNEENKGVETSHKQGIEKRSVLPVVTGILGGVLKGAKIFGTGASILTGLAEIVNKALKGQVMISGIQFDNHTAEELPTLQIEYSTLNEENKGVETSHKQGIEKRSVLPVVTGILGGVLKGAKIFGTGASILTGLAEIVNKALKGQVMISGIQFDNHTAEELPTLQIEYSTLNEENKGVETSHKQGIEKRSVLPVVTGILGGVLKGAKIFGTGASILTGLAEIVNKALKGQVMISGIQFDNHTAEELPTLQIEYSTLNEENKGVETSHKQGIEKRSVLPVVTGILGGVLKGAKIFGTGASILTGLAEIVNKALKGQVMISGIQFDNHTAEELPTLQIEYSTLNEENKGVETSHKQGIEKRSVLPVVTGILGGVLKGAKIFGTGASILTGLAEIVNKALKGQVMISGIQFDNHTAEELPTLQIEYSTLNEENKGVETSHKQGIEKRSVLPVVTGILGGVLKGAKIFGTGASILTGLAEIVNKALKGQVMISGIQFDNHTAEELPTLQIEYSTLNEENKGVETSHKQGIEKRSVLPVVTGILGGVLKGAKIFGTGASILTGLAEIVNKALKGQVMISGIQFDNHTAEELPTLQIEYSTLNEENKGVETSHKQGIEKRSVLPVVTGILGGVLKGTKIFAKGASILTGLAEIVNKALKGQVMISGIQFDNHTQEELPTLQIEYSTLSEENKDVETSHKRVLEKRSVVHVVKSVLGGVIKGTKIFGTGASILTGLAEIVNKALKGQVMISGIQFDNHTQEEFPTLNMEYSTLSEEMKVSPTSMPAFCVEPKFVGVCKAMTARYFFNAQTGYCELFLYGGCGGNQNNFLTLEDCKQTCHPNAQSLW